MDTTGILWLFGCFLLSLVLILVAEHADSPALDLSTRPFYARGP